MSTNTKIKRMNKKTASADLRAARDCWKSEKGHRSNRAQHKGRWQVANVELWQGEHNKAYG